MAGRGLFSKLFRRERPKLETVELETGLDSLCVGDLLVVQGFESDLDDAMLEVTNIHSYTANGQTWWEAVASDRTRQLRVEWWGEGEDLDVAASREFTPVGLDAVGITEEDLVKLDEENSLDNRLTALGRLWHYRNSYEATFHRDRREQGVSFWMWDLVADDGTEVMAVSKFENAPFEVHFATVIDPDTIEVYPGEAHFAKEDKD